MQPTTSVRAISLQLPHMVTYYPHLHVSDYQWKSVLMTEHSFFCCSGGTPPKAAMPLPVHQRRG